MVDVCKPATLRGFSVSVADVGDQMHLCHPLLSFESDRALYLAHRLNWRSDPDALAIADPKEASMLGTLLPPTCRRSIASGEGVVAVGTGFVHAAKVAKVELLNSEIRFAHVDVSSTGCWIGVATPVLYAALRTRLVEGARTAFDETLGDAALRRRRLSKRGDAALLLMRKSGLGRRDDLAIRQLAGARQNGEFDLCRRLLIRFALELDMQEAVLDERVKQYIANVADWAGRRRSNVLYQWLRSVLRQRTRGMPDEDRPQDDLKQVVIEAIKMNADTPDRDHLSSSEGSVPQKKRQRADEDLAEPAQPV